jgi:hypothetical protein
MTEIQHRRCNDLRRWKLELPRGISIRLHHWVKGDPLGYEHSHPWSFITIVLSGGYDDVGEGHDIDEVRAPAIRFRPTHWRHSVLAVKPRTWSIVITGLRRTDWRFWMWGREVDQSAWNQRVCD